jgi:predicted metal-binding membrane protein
MTVARSTSRPFGGLNIRQAGVPALALIVVVFLGWFFVVRQAGGVDGAMAGTMGMSLWPFLLMWLPMVVAMMFPTVVPSAVVAVRGGENGATSGSLTVRTAVFLTVYLLVWMVFGLAVFLVLEGAARVISIPPEGAKWLAAGIYAVGGLYQFTPVKDRCRSRCQSTRCAYAEGGSTFLQTARAATHHGLVCIGCCAAFMVVLIAVGMANLAAMAILTVIIFVERHTFARAALVSRIAGALLVLAAVLTPFVSWLHPGLPGPDAGDMSTPM